MTSSDFLPVPSVSLINNRPATTSLAIAEHFGKPHKDVLASVRRLVQECPKEFTGRNFSPSEYTDETGRALPMFTVYFDGFMLLVMGYTGKKALDMKLAYIDAFNKMKERLQITLPDFNDPVAAARAWADEREHARKLASKNKELVVENNELRMTNDVLEIALGDNRDWKAVTAIPWLRKYFRDTSSYACSRIGRRLTKLSEEMGHEVRKIEDKRYPSINVYNIAVIEQLKQDLDTDSHLLSTIRI